MDCGELRLLVSRGRCERCDRRRPEWPVEYAARLADRLPQPPGWLPGFAAHLATTVSPSHAVLVLRRLGSLLTEGGPATPTALLGRASRPGRGVGSLARALEAFLVDHGLALPLDTREERARQARARRVADVPPRYRSAVADFAEAQLAERARARRAGTKPRADSTLETHLAAVRDLALFLARTRPHLDGWAMVAAGDIEAFLTGRAPSYRARTLHPLRAFFRFARSRRLLVADPTRTLAANSNPGFAGRVIDVDRQRSLLRRWSSNPTGQHPHEAFIGLMALLHGASSTELRTLKVDDIEPTARAIRLGKRPYPVPIDPFTWAALRRCLNYRATLATTNPHLIVTRTSKTTLAPATRHFEQVLHPAGVTIRQLRSTRLAHLVVALDPVLVAEAFAIQDNAATHYLADHVDATRLDR